MDGALIGMIRFVRRVLLIAIGLAAATAAWASSDETRYAKLAVFANALHFIETSHVDEVDQDALIYGAIKGMVGRLDRHSQFIEPEELTRIRAQADDTPGSLGLEIASAGSEIQVVEVRPRSSADRAGLAIGDVVVELDGTVVGPKALPVAKTKLSGPVGKVVPIVVRRDGRLRRRTLVHSAAHTQTVSVRPLQAGITYIKISRFNLETASGVIRALENVEPKSGIVLDLRANPGGILEQAVRVADLWIDKGIIVTTIGRGHKSVVETAHPKGTHRHRLAVLVDGQTASAAEILAGALQDHARATIVGTHTLGKGTVQTVIELEDGSALKLTVARYKTPSGKFVEGVGIRPDVVVPPSGPNGDRALDDAVKRLVYGQ